MIRAGARPDAVVVGAGIVGAACALELARAGLRVVVVDPRAGTGGSTAAGMGHLVVLDSSEAQFALTAYSLELWRALMPDLPPDCEFDPCGTLWIAEDGEQYEAARRKQAYYAARGVTAELLDAHALAEAEPQLCRPLTGALLVPGDCVLYPPAAARYFLAEAARAGAVPLAAARVEAIQPGGVMIDGELLATGLVVNAAGAAAPALTPGLPVVPRKGHLAITDRYPGFCRHQIVELGYLVSAHQMTAESVAFNVQPRATGQILIGSSRELVGWDASINRRVLGQMLRRALRFMPGLSAVSVIRSWTGFRPATPDKLPLVGRWEETDGLWLATGHEGLGITTSVGSARLLADLVTGRMPAIDPAPYAPMRLLSAAERDG